MTTRTHPSVDQLFDLLTGLPLSGHDATAALSDLGIDSLAAMELLLAVEDAIGRSVDLGAVEALQSVGDLRSLLDDLAPGQRS